MGAPTLREIWDKELQENLGPKNKEKRQVTLDRKRMLKVGQCLSVWLVALDVVGTFRVCELLSPLAS